MTKKKSEEEDDFDTPYRSPQSIRLPFREQDFPVIMREHIAVSPASRKVPIFLSTLSPLGALATRVRLKYPYDLLPHAILLQVILEAPPSFGKRCFTQVERNIMEPTLEARDESQRRAEQEYREKKNARAQNERIGEAPITTIRCIPPATSKTVLVKRSDYYQRFLYDGLTFWMWAEELAELADAGKNGFSNLRTILRIAYDLYSKFGQDYASDNSYSGIADVCICCMFGATPQDVDEVFNKREIMGGGCSRVILVSLEDETGAKPAIFRPLSEEEQSLIKAALELMMQDTYTSTGLLQPVIELDTSWMDPAIDRFTAEMCRKVRKMEKQGIAGYHAIDVFRKRASVNGFRSAGLMYYLYQLENRLADAQVPGAVHREEEEIRKHCIKAYRFLSKFCLESVVNRWGRKYEEYLTKRKQAALTEKKQPLFEQLPNSFTRVQLVEMIEKNGLDTEARFFVSQWKHKGWIAKTCKDVYQKLIK